MVRLGGADDWVSVETLQDFIAFLEALAGDARDDRLRDIDIATLFDATAEWLSHDLQSEQSGSLRQHVEPPSWRGFAFILGMAVSDLPKRRS